MRFRIDPWLEIALAALGAVLVTTLGGTVSARSTAEVDAPAWEASARGDPAPRPGALAPTSDSIAH